MYSVVYNDIKHKLLISSLTDNRLGYDNDYVLQWIRYQNEKVFVQVTKQRFSQLKQWSFDEEKESLRHISGKFFSVEGIRVETDFGFPKSWDQPIINQPEIGYLGFIAKEFDGVFHFLAQAKIEPGNVNYVQISPTLQATRSNYTQVHQGKKPHYLEYFQQAGRNKTIIDQLQSEQGSRFLAKRNRNIVIIVDENIPLLDNYLWLTLRQLKELLQYDNLVNMDSRTVLSCINFCGLNHDKLFFQEGMPLSTTTIDSVGEIFLKSALCKQDSYHSLEEILSLLASLKSHYDLKILKIPLNKMKDWSIGEYEIYHNMNRFFKVVAVDVEIDNREVVKWSQPMIEPAHQDLCAFICKDINEVVHFAVQVKLECGNFDKFEFAPTVQCSNYDCKENIKESVPYLIYVLQAKSEQIVFDTLQSEEGGRFYKEQNRNMLILADDNFSMKLQENYIWMTLSQIHYLLRFNNYLNIQARSLIAAIPYHRD